MLSRLVLASLYLTAAPVLVAGLSGAAWAGQDRYGPPSPDADQAQTAAPSAYIYWPGKPTAVSAAVSAQGAPSAAEPPQSMAAPSPARPRGQLGPSAALNTASGQAAAPSASASWNPGAAPARAAENLPPKFYSVQRQFGVSPQVPLPSQFFADSGSTDLAAPPPPPAPPALAGQAATGSTAAAIRQRQAEQNLSDSGDTSN